MVRGQVPTDYMIMVPADPRSLSGLTEKAEQILESGHSAKSSVRLTRREEEVLDGVLKSLANKEIASLLNLIRTYREISCFLPSSQIQSAQPHGIAARIFAAILEVHACSDRSPGNPFRPVRRAG